MTVDSTAPTAAVAMTLAALAATGATPRPSGEDVTAQKLRIAAGIKQQLSDPGLATKGTWQLAWLALSPDNANMAYIAKDTSGSNAFAVVVRGTAANSIDTLEDLDVGTVAPFTVGGSSPVSISKGAMTAFTQVAGMTDGSPGAGSNLARALTLLLTDAPPRATVTVIGHSLGGCIASVLALYLQAQNWGSLAPQFGVITFAAPTAGLKDFADRFNSVQWNVNQGYVNNYDIVPRAWADLDAAKKWYPATHGPAAPADVKDLLIPEIEALTGPNVYVQPNNAMPPLNPNYDTFDPTVVKSSTEDFLAQVAYQHANSTYLGLLQAPQLPTGPVVQTVSPNVGTAGTQITITGRGFGSDSVVDFGPVPCVSKVVSDTQMIATAPEGVGVVDVRVTGSLGTSPAVPTGQFAYGGPQPVLVTGISPDNGKTGTTVTITGVGFAGNPTVYFGKNLATSTLVSPTRITATAPSSGTPFSKTVDIRVLMNGYLSPAVPVDEFTYPS
ncbi:IPT/TIG domain-containing protein [Kitasatospora sp. NPDC085879]|uniref:IPT/TIG domain-containing protein n=1 Tax=Kitasatospora sp. NPDC085879 TaxID=3154769 RepID=UPI003445EF76